MLRPCRTRTVAVSSIDPAQAPAETDEGKRITAADVVVAVVVAVESASGGEHVGTEEPLSLTLSAWSPLS